MAELKSLSIANTDFFDYIHPIGSFYLTEDSESNPEALFGGSWEQIKGKFLYGITDNETATISGGEKEHVLTQSEFPNVSVQARGVSTHVAQKAAVLGSAYNIRIAFQQAPNWSVSGMQVVGGNQPHNNMPPYYGVYIWHRTA